MHRPPIDGNDMPQLAPLVLLRTCDSTMGYPQLERELNSAWGFLLRDESSRNQAYDTCLDVDSQRMHEDGATVTLWGCHRSVQQQSRFDALTGRIVNGSGKCLVGAAELGSQAVVAECDATEAAQRWARDGDRFYWCGSDGVCLG